MNVTIVKECFHISIQIYIDGDLYFSSIRVDVFRSWFYTDSVGNSLIWYRNEITPTTRKRILGYINIAYPSVSQVDHALIVTWYNTTNPQFHNGRVSKAP